MAVLDNAWNERYQTAQTIIVHGYYSYSQLRNTGCYPGCNPFNQNFLAEIRKFLGVERSLSIPIAKRVPHSFTCKMKNAGSLLFVLKLDDHFDGDINDIVCANSFVGI